jgi:hypothetical protein
MAEEFSERTLALIDHMYLGCEVLGMDFQEVPHRFLFSFFIQKDPYEETPVYDLAQGVKKRMILWPRGTFKTSAMIVEIVQFILNYPNIRICFLTGGDTLAKRQLARVKKVFEHPSARFKELFPEFCINPRLRRQLGNAHEFTVPCRTNDTLAEPTMSISTAKSVKAGSHYDLICVDDLVNETNYKSDKALQDCIQNYKDICPLLAPDGYMYITGTRYSFGDLYEDIQAKAKKEMAATGERTWMFSILPCWVRYCLNCEQHCHKRDIDHLWEKNATEPTCMSCKCKGWQDSGLKDVLFPRFRCRDGRTEGHTIKFLEQQRRELGDEFFANQYENNPIASGTQTFTPELLAKQTLFQLADLPTGLQCPTFFVGDLGYAGASDSRDMSVFFVCRYWQGQIFVIDCLAGKWGATDVCENLFIGVLKYRPAMIWIEGFPAWEAFNTVLEMFARNKNIQRFPVEWLQLTYHKDAKKIRMGTVQVPLKERRLWLYAGMPYYERLCEDLYRWPKLGKHDDFGDCLGLVVSVPTGYQLEALPRAMDSSKSWLRKIHEPKEDSSSYDARIAGSF